MSARGDSVLLQPQPEETSGVVERNPRSSMVKYENVDFGASEKLHFDDITFLCPESKNDTSSIPTRAVPVKCPGVGNNSWREKSFENFICFSSFFLKKKKRKEKVFPQPQHASEKLGRGGCRCLFLIAIFAVLSTRLLNRVTRTSRHSGKIFEGSGGAKYTLNIGDAISVVTAVVDAVIISRQHRK